MIPIARTPLIYGTVIAIVVSLAATASADHLAGEGCAVTPGGWASDPRGHNPGAFLDAHFDDVFPSGFTLGDYTFGSADDVRDGLDDFSGDNVYRHGVALFLNVAFGEAGLLDGETGGTYDDPGNAYDGATPHELLDAVDVALMDDDRSNPEYSDLIEAMTAFNEENALKGAVCVDEECPDDLDAEANEDGTVTLTWDEVDDADGYNIYRATGDGPFVFLDTTTSTEHTDDTTANGITYHYKVTSFEGEDESEGCDEVTVTSVPFFGLAAGAAALVGGTGAYAALRRRA